MSEPELVAQLTTLFREAGTAHHRAYLLTNGEDAEWPAWYAAHLAPRMAGLLGRAPGIDALAADLVLVDRIYRETGPRTSWAEFYAEWFVQRSALAGFTADALPLPTTGSTARA